MCWYCGEEYGIDYIFSIKEKNQSDQEWERCNNKFAYARLEGTAYDKYSMVCPTCHALSTRNYCRTPGCNSLLGKHIINYYETVGNSGDDKWDLYCPNCGLSR